MTVDWNDIRDLRADNAAIRAENVRLGTELAEMERRVQFLGAQYDQQAIHIHELMRRVDWFQKLIDHLIAIATE